MLDRSNEYAAQSERVRDHFDSTADDFDELIPKLIPGYATMTDALVEAIPFAPRDPIRAMDLGCGTGTVAKKFAIRFPCSHLTLIDNAERMLELARRRLAFHSSCRFVNADFNSMMFGESYHVVMSSLALHHLVTDAAKIRFYRLVHDALEPGGFFINFDPVLPALPEHVALYEKRHEDFMNASLTREEAESRWHRGRKDEDFPAKMTDHIRWMEDAGFTQIDVLCKDFSFALWSASKK